MRLPQLLAFVALAFLGVCIYFILEAVWAASIGVFFHARLLGIFFDRILPICIGLVIAGCLGAWRPSTHVVYKALAVFVAVLMLVPARFATAYLGILLCGSLSGGCFD